MRRQHFRLPEMKFRRIAQWAWATALIGCLSFADAASAETPQMKKQLLGLPELIERAISNSPEIREVQSDILSSRQDLEQVKAAYYPQLETMALVGPVRDARKPLIINGQITDPSPGLDLSSIGIFGRLELTATQPLYTFGKLENRKSAAMSGLHAKEFGINDKKGRIALSIKELYYGLVLAQMGLESVDEAEDFYNDAEQKIQRLLKLNSPYVKDSDLYRIDSYRAETRRFKAEAQKGLKVSYFALKALIRLPPDMEFAPVDKKLAIRDENPPALDTYLKSAVAQRPEFKQLSAALAAKEALVKAAVSDRYPSFFAALRASFAGAPGRDTLNNQYIPDDFNHAYGGVVLGAKWNFDFGISSANVEKMRAEYSKLLSTKQFAEMNIPIQVAKSYQDCLEFREAARFYETASVASRRWVVSALADFDMGIESADEMLRAIEKYGQMQGHYIEAVFKFNLSTAELEYAAGLKTW